MLSSVMVQNVAITLLFLMLTITLL